MLNAAKRVAIHRFVNWSIRKRRKTEAGRLSLSDLVVERWAAGTGV